MSITPEHLERVAARLEATTHREIDRLRGEVAGDIRGVHARVGELRDHVKAQNGRIGKLEHLVRGLQFAYATIRSKSSQASALPDVSRAKLAAGIVALLAGLTAFVEAAHAVGNLLKTLVKGVQP